MELEGEDCREGETQPLRPDPAAEGPTAFIEFTVCRGEILDKVVERAKFKEDKYRVFA